MGVGTFQRRPGLPLSWTSVQSTLPTIKLYNSWFHPAESQSTDTNLDSTLLFLELNLQATLFPFHLHVTNHLDSTSHKYNPLIQVFLTLCNPKPVQSGLHYDLFPVIVFMTTPLQVPLFFNPLSPATTHTCSRAHNVPLWAIPHICHRHHRRCLCKNFLSGVYFSRLSEKNAYILLFQRHF